jgi:hypothetical protein
MIGAQGFSERSERRIGRSELFGAAKFRLRTPFVFSDKSFGEANYLAQRNSVEGHPLFSRIKILGICSERFALAMLMEAEGSARVQLTVLPTR